MLGPATGQHQPPAGHQQPGEAGDQRRVPRAFDVEQRVPADQRIEALVRFEVLDAAVNPRARRQPRAGDGQQRVGLVDAGDLVPGGQHLATDMIVKLVVEMLHVDRAMDGLKVSLVRHVVDDFLRVAREFTQWFHRPVDPARLVPLLERRNIIVRFAAFGIVPHPDAPGTFDHLVRFDAGRLGNGVAAGGIGNVIALAIGGEAPAVPRTADRIPVDLFPVADDVAGRVAGDVDPHVRAIGIEQHDPPALAAVQHHVLPEEAHRLGFLRDLFGHRDHEPAARERVFAHAVFG